MAKSPPDTVMTIAELSKDVKVFRSTLSKLAVANEIPGTNIGKH